MQDKKLARAIKETLERKSHESGKELKGREEAEKVAGVAWIKAQAERERTQSSFDEDAEKRKRTEASMAELEAARSKAEVEQGRLMAAVAAAKSAADEKAAAAAEKEAAYEAAMGLGGASGEGSSKNLQGQLSDARAAVLSSQTEMDKEAMTIKHLSKQIKETAKKLGEARSTGGKLEKQHATLQADVDRMRTEIGKMPTDSHAELSAKYETARAEFARLRERESGLARGAAAYDFTYTDPERNFDRSRVLGTVASNLRVKDEKHFTALEALAGSRLHQVIVDTDKTGVLLIEKGRLLRRVTLIALNRVQPHVIPAAKVAAAKKLVGAAKVSTPVELLAFDARVRGAMEHVFGGALVCTDGAAADEICKKLGLKTVTLEGDIFDPSGMLIGGSRARAGDSLLARLGVLADARRESGVAEAEVSKLAAEVEAGRAAAERHASLASSLEIKVHELEVHAQQMRSTPVGQLAEAHEKLQASVAEAQANVAKAQAAHDAAKSRAADIEKQIKNFEGDREASMKAAKASKEAAAKEAQKA